MLHVVLATPDFLCSIACLRLQPQMHSKHLSFTSLTLFNLVVFKLHSLYVCTRSCFY
jgi:hypothetical protein